MSVRMIERPDGTRRYIVRRFMGYRHDGTPDQRQETYRTKAEAEAADARLLAERDAMRGKSGRMPLSVYVERYYWPRASTRLAATSKDTYEKELRLRILPNLGRYDLADIDRPMIQRMVDGCSTESVAWKAVSVLKTVLNEAKADGLIATNPAEARFTYPPKGEKRDNGIVITTFTDIYALLDIVSSNGSECVQKIAYTGLLEGLRPEERYALDWESVDIASQTIEVKAAYTAATPKHGGNDYKEPKTEKSARIVPMHPMFSEWLEGLDRGAGPFIVGANGNRISPSTAQKRWRAFLRDNPHAVPVTIENMRHSFATSYLHADGNVEDLSRILGHSDINTTYRRYVKPSVDDLRRGMLAVANK